MKAVHDEKPAFTLLQRVGHLCNKLLQLFTGNPET